MRLEQLEYLVTVAETHSMNTASHLLHVTHQNISKAIRQLEEEMGFAVLNRNKQGTTLTEKGSELYNYAKQMMVLKQKIQQLSQPLPEQNERIIYEFLVATIFYPTFTIVANKIQEQHPHIQFFPKCREPIVVMNKLKTEVLTTPLVLAMMENTDFQKYQAYFQETYDIYILGYEPILLVVGGLSAIHAKNSLTLNELSQVPLVLYQESLEYDNFYLSCLKNHGFKSTNIIEYGPTAVCRTALQSGTAATLGTKFSFDTAVYQRIKNAKTIPIYPLINIAHFVLVRRDADPITKQFAEYFLEICEIN